MVEYVILDVGMGGLVVVLGGAVIVIFAVMAAVILRFSIRDIKNELKKKSEAEELKPQDVTETAEAEQKNEEV